jgi:hypothetical protein
MALIESAAAKHLARRAPKMARAALERDWEPVAALE